MTNVSRNYPKTKREAVFYDDNSRRMVQDENGKLSLRIMLTLFIQINMKNKQSKPEKTLKQRLFQKTKTQKTSELAFKLYSLTMLRNWLCQHNGRLCSE